MSTYISKAYSPKVAVVNGLPVVVYEATNKRGVSQIYSVMLSERAESIIGSSKVSYGTTGNNKKANIAASYKKTTLGDRVDIGGHACVAWENDGTGVSEIMTSNYSFTDIQFIQRPITPPDSIIPTTEAKTWSFCETNPDPFALYLTDTETTLCNEYDYEYNNSFQLVRREGSNKIYGLDSSPTSGTILWNVGGNNIPNKKTLYWAYNVVGPGTFYIPQYIDMYIGGHFIVPGFSGEPAYILMSFMSWVAPNHPIYPMNSVGALTFTGCSYTHAKIDTMSPPPGLASGGLRCSYSSSSCLSIRLEEGQSTTLFALKLENVGSVPISGTIDLSNSIIRCSTSPDVHWS